MDLIATADEIAQILTTQAGEKQWSVLLPEQNNGNPINPRITDGHSTFFIRLLMYSNKWKLRVTGVYPESSDGNPYFYSTMIIKSGEAPAINMAIYKSAEQMAYDIHKRFLPDYRKVLAKCLERKAQYEEHEQHLAQLMDLLEAAGFEVNRKGKYFDFKDQLNFDKGYLGRTQINANSITFELSSVPADKALKILAYAKKIIGA